MLDIPEYDMDDPTIINEDEAIGRAEAEAFQKELTRIAGLNRFGEPNLVRRWGVTYRDPMSTNPDQIKYLDFFQNGKQYGERRHILEIHRTPEFLVRSGRYRNLHDSDDLQEFYFCKACDAELKLDNGDLPPCKCGSTRNYLRQVRRMGAGQLLQPFPEKGCYDYWLRLERANLTYHPPDGEALKVIRALWEWELTPQNQRDALEQANRELERRQEILRERQQRPTNLHFGSELILPYQ
jgi:hypothetical protein